MPSDTFLRLVLFFAVTLTVLDVLDDFLEDFRAELMKSAGTGGVASSEGPSAGQQQQDKFFETVFDVIVSFLAVKASTHLIYIIGFLLCFFKRLRVDVPLFFSHTQRTCTHLQAHAHQHLLSSSYHHKKRSLFDAFDDTTSVTATQLQCCAHTHTHTHTNTRARTHLRLRLRARKM